MPRPSNVERRTPRREIAALALAILAAAPSAAQDDFVGLSSVRAQRFDNEDLGDFPADSGEEFGAAFATGDFDGDGFQDLATGLSADSGSSGNECVLCGAAVVRYGAAGGGLEGGPAAAFLSQQVFEFCLAPPSDDLPNFPDRKMLSLELFHHQ